MAVRVFDVEFAAEVVAAVEFDFEAHGFFIVNVELGSSGRVGKDGAGLGLVAPGAEPFFEGTDFGREAPLVGEFVLDGVVHGEDEEEGPVFVGRIVGSDDGVDLLAAHAGVAEGADVVVPFAMGLVGSPHEGFEEAVLFGALHVFDVDVVICAENPAPVFDGNGVEREGKLEVVETAVGEFGIFVPVEGKGVPFNAREKVGLFADGEKHVEKGIGFVEAECAALRSVGHVGRREGDEVATDVDGMVVPEGVRGFGGGGGGSGRRSFVGEGRVIGSGFVVGKEGSSGEEKKREEVFHDVEVYVGEKFCSMKICAEHAGEFLFTSRMGKFGDVCGSVCAVGLLGDEEVVGGTLCDLDEVGDAENLSFLC